jgi:hypothetical protein
LNRGGKNKIFLKDTPEYNLLKKLLKDHATATDSNDDLNVAFIEKQLEGLLEDKAKVVVDKYSDKLFRVENGLVFVKNDDGTESSLPTVIGDRLVQFAQEGLPYKPLLNFWRRLLLNPSYDAVHRLFVCLETNNHPISPDGRFLAWKKVKRVGNTDKLVDIYSGKFDNSVGATPTVRRNEVDDDSDKTCSNGLHLSSFSYACNNYGSSNDVLVEVLCDPANVVAVPTDYNNQKMRVTTYEVVRVCENKIEDKSKIYGDYEPLTDDDDNYCSECGDEDCCGECLECDNCGSEMCDGDCDFDPDEDMDLDDDDDDDNGPCCVCGDPNCHGL